MKRLNSYQTKIFIALWVFGILLVVIYQLAGHGIALLTRHADGVGRFELKREVAHVNDYYKEHHRASYPNSRFYKTYAGMDELPPALRPKVQDLDIGEHLIELENADGSDQFYYIAVFRQPGGGGRAYVLYDYTRYADEYIDYQILKASKRFSLAFLAAGVLGVFIGLIASKKLTAPLKALGHQVRNLDPEALPTRFSRHYPNDEVGILARALESSMQRIKAFIEREKHFTRDASHELRTPVTIIKGAVELIHQLPESSSPALARPVKRIERSLRNMEGIIETFLWLAREHHVKTEAPSCLAADTVQHAIEENRYLIAAKPVTVDTIIDHDPRIAVPENILRIVVVNLIRNAFQYTSQGQITIVVKPDFFQITNTGIEISPDLLNTIKEPFQKGRDSKGFGIGLAIVERLCSRFDFQLDIDCETNSNTTVRLARRS